MICVLADLEQPGLCKIDEDFQSYKLDTIFVKYSDLVTYNLTVFGKRYGRPLGE